MGQHRSKPARGVRYWQLLFGFTALLVIVNVAVTYYSLNRVHRTYDALNHSMEMITALRTSYSGLQDLAISERDYLLRGDEDSLQIYRDSVATVAEQMRQIQSAKSELDSTLLVAELESLVLKRLRVDSLDNISVPVSVLPQSRDAWRASESRALLREIRTSVNAIVDAYSRQLEARRAAVASNQRAIIITLVMVTILGVVGLAMIYRVLRRTLAQQARWEDALLQQTQELEDRVAERTASLQHYSLELQRSNRELEDFAFVASHDLQEPLRKILAFGDRLESRYGEQLGDGKDYLDRMRSAASRMARLINDLLEFSRVTTKAGEFVDVSLDEVLADVLEDLEETIDSSQAVVRADPLPVIEADNTQMHQLFQNLIGNATKFVAADTRPEVRITANQTTRTETTESGITLPADVLLEVHVIDNGIGFDEEYAERIFKPFQRLVTRREYSGTGIGLALCRRIVERHGGTLTVSSEPGRGSDFTIILPMTQTVPDDPAVLEDSASPPAQEITEHEHEKA